jgi:hypothetical protein
MQDEVAEMEAEIAIAKARIQAIDFEYLTGDLKTAPTAQVSHAARILVYAMLESMVEAGPKCSIWHGFLREALNETIYRMSKDE